MATNQDKVKELNRLTKSSETWAEAKNGSESQHKKG